MRNGIRAGTAVAALALTLHAGPPAWAGEPAAVASSSPRTGSVVPGAPPVVTLRMSAPVGTATATVTDGCGEPVPSTVSVVGKRVSVRLAVSHAADGHPDHTSAGGPWRVAWSTVGADGRTVRGAVPFTVGGAMRCDLPPVPQTVVAQAAPPSAPTDPLLMRVLQTLAALGVVLTVVRLAQRRRTAPPIPHERTGRTR